MPYIADGLPPSGAAGPAEKDTRQRIILAASQVFTQNGYSRATTRNIAKAAGLSEVTLFRYFDSKETLFRATVEDYGPMHFLRRIEGRLTGNYGEDLQMIGTIFTEVMLERIDAISLVLSEVNHFPEMRPLFAQQPEALWRMLARYIQSKIEDGTVRAVHPETAAQAFFGACFTYALQKKMLHLEPEKGAAAQDFVKRIVDIFVEGTIAR